MKYSFSVDDGNKSLISCHGVMKQINEIARVNCELWVN